MFLGISFLLWALACLVIATIYAFIWPRPQGRPRPLWMHLILRWFHMLVWLTLAIGAMLFWIEYPAFAEWALRLALILYLIFIATALVERRWTAKD